MTSLQPVPSETQTLDVRMAAGRMPASEALRYAIMLAESIQRLHEEGRVHGALSPASIAIRNGGLELLQGGSDTRYMAPEVAQGHPADARADIFSFGAILYEILTGQKAFPEGGLYAVPSSGSRPVDRVVQTCLAEDPNKRYQRIPKLFLELKLLAVAARRAESASAVRREDPAAVLRGEMRLMEDRIAARIESHDRARAELEGLVTNSLLELRTQLTNSMAQLDAGAQRMMSLEQSVDTAVQRMVSLEQSVDGGVQRVASLEQSVDGGAQRVASLEQSLVTGSQRVATLEQSVDSIDRAAAEVRDTVTKDLEAFSKSLKSHASAIESARIAMSQTDNLVERVVEALEALQSIVLEGPVAAH